MLGLKFEKKVYSETDTNVSPQHVTKDRTLVDTVSKYFSHDRHHLDFNVWCFMKAESSPGLFCFQSELVMVSQTRRWDKTKLRREPGIIFELI